MSIYGAICAYRFFHSRRVGYKLCLSTLKKEFVYV
jgi:hypothetical protein